LAYAVLEGLGASSTHPSGPFFIWSSGHLDIGSSTAVFGCV